MTGILKYQNPLFLDLLWLLIPAALLILLFVFWRKKVMARLGDTSLVERQLITGSKWAVPRGFFMLGCLGLLAVTLANPQAGAKPQKVKQKGLDIVLAIDVSASMRAQDIKPDRMARARQFASRIVQELSGSKIGIIVFAARAYVQSPLTTDPSAAQMYLNVINTDMVQSQGTAIGDALKTAQGLLLPPSGNPQAIQTTSKVAILISDGENHEDDAFETARELAQNNILVYTIGAGERDGAPVPADENSQGEYVRDKTGEAVISKLDENMLTQIATITGGEFYSLAESDASLNELIGSLSRLQAEEREVELLLDYESRFQWFLGIALALFLMDMVMGSLVKKKVKDED